MNQTHRVIYVVVGMMPPPGKLPCETIEIDFPKYPVFYAWVAILIIIIKKT